MARWVVQLVGAVMVRAVRGAFASAGRGAVAAVCLIAGLSAPALATIHVEVTASPDVVRPGQKVDLEITVTNDGPSTRSGVTVVLDYPAAMAALSNVLFDGTCPGANGACDATEQATMTIATLPAGRGVTFSLPAGVLVTATDGTLIPFDVDVIDDAALQAEGTDEVIVDSARTIELALTEETSPVAPGGQIQYSLRYGVLAASAGSPGAVLRLPLPAGTTFVSASGGGIESAGAVEWTLGNLNPGAVGERRAVVLVNAGVAAGTIVRAEAVYRDASGGAPADIVGYDAAVRIENAIPMQLAITAGPDPVRQSQTMDLEMTVTNTGAFDRSNVVLRVEYPEGLNALSNTLMDGVCPGANGACDGRERAVFTLGVIPAGEGRTVTMPVTPAAATPTGRVLTFKADVSDSTTEKRRGATSVAVKGDRQVNLALVDDSDPAEPGGDITYTLTWGVLQTSAGSPAAVLQLPVPAGTTFVSATEGGTLVGAVGGAGGVVEWAIGSLNPGVSGECEATVHVDDAAQLGSIIAAAASYADAATPPNEARSPATTRVQAADSVPLDVVVIAGPDAVRIGETMDLQVTVTNRGVLDRSGVVLRLEYPDHLLSFSNILFDGVCPGANGACDPTERAVFTIGALAAGEGVTFQMRPRVVAGTVDGAVIVLEADATDSGGGWRRAGTSLAVDGARLLNLGMHESIEPVHPGDDVIYTLTYGTFNSGAGAPGAALRFTVPEGTSFVSASNAGKLVGGVVQWDIGSLGPGEGGERTVTLHVDPAAALGTILLAAADVDSLAASARQTRTLESTRVEAESPLIVNLEATPLPAPLSSIVTMNLSVENTTGLNRTGVVLKATFPDGFNVLPNATFGGVCPGANGACDAQEHAVFTIPTLPAGQVAQFTMSPTLAAATMRGTVVNFDGFATDSTGFMARDGDAVMVGDLAPFSPACDCETDGNATQVDVFDLLRFLDAWFTQTGAADLDGDAGVDVFDLLFFLDCWFPASAGQPCP